MKYKARLRRKRVDGKIESEEAEGEKTVGASGNRAAMEWSGT